jgi:hypothetical protein
VWFGVWGGVGGGREGGRDKEEERLLLMNKIAYIYYFVFGDSASICIGCWVSTGGG